MHTSQVQEILSWVSSQHERMLNLVIKWSSINSHSENLDGLKIMLETLKKDFTSLNGSMEILNLPPRITVSKTGHKNVLESAKALRISKRRNSSKKILLNGHMDTVFPINHHFQSVKRLNENILEGPGVADMKGGLAVMLIALEALELYSHKENIGWEILINPDEEIGSVSSYHYLVQAAKNNDLGLVFEPAFPDGALVSSRKGSANIDILAKGKAAHAGKDFSNGKSAILSLADFILKTNSLSNEGKGITVNCGFISGGGPVNIVPDTAFCRINIRTIDPQDFIVIENQIKEFLKEPFVDETTLTIAANLTRTPKPFSNESLKLFKLLETCANEEGYYLLLRPSGGASDGNILAENNLPVLDSLGVIGSEIHTDKESLEISSLEKRARLVALFLLNLAKEGI